MTDKPDFVPPQNDDGEKDLLESLLIVAAEKAAKQEADDALKKGFVTREQLNAALGIFGDTLETNLVEKLSAALTPQIDSFVKKGLEGQATRKSTIAPSAEDERDADPVAYLLKKGRESGPESYDETEKRLIWELTYPGLADGMTVLSVGSDDE